MKFDITFLWIDKSVWGINVLNKLQKLAMLVNENIDLELVKAYKMYNCYNTTNVLGNPTNDSV